MKKFRVTLLPMILLFLYCSITQSSERWIIHASAGFKNNLEIFQTAEFADIGLPLFRMNFEQSSFLIFETENPHQKTQLENWVKSYFLQLAPDYEIEVPEVSEIQTKKTESIRYSYLPVGWHVNHLKYSALPLQFDGRGITIALLDTGADITHPALRSHLWKDSTSGKSGYNFADSNDNLEDAVGHGTHCAGSLVADPSSQAVGDLENAPQGIAQGSKVMILKIIGKNKDKTAFLSTAAQAIQFATQHGAQIISNSWRVRKSMSTHVPSPGNLAILAAAIKEAGDQGILFIAGAGNDSIDLDTTSDSNYPIGLPGLWNLMGVAASDSTDDLAPLSNFGSNQVHFAAPGIDIVSTHLDHRWQRLSGTSMATPLVAGLLARGLSAGMNPQFAITHLLEVSRTTPDLSDKIKAKGVVDPVRYLF